MTRFVRFAAAAVVLAAAPLAWAASITFTPEVGRQDTFETTYETTTTLTQGDQSGLRVVRQTVTREQTILEASADPKGLKAAYFSQSAETIIKREQNGNDLLAEVPAENRTRQMPPTVSVVVRGPDGLPAEMPASIDNPAAAVDVLMLEALARPAKDVKSGATDTVEVDLGAVKATLTRTFGKTETVGGAKCLTFTVAGTPQFTGDLGQRATISDFAMDAAVEVGAGVVRRASGQVTLTEASGEATQVSKRQFEQKLVTSRTLDDAALAAAKAGIDALETALEKAKGQDFAAAAQAVQGFADAHPQHAWLPALRGLQARLVSQQKLTTPMQDVAELRQAVRQLQQAYNRAAQQRNQGEVRQIVGVAAQLVQTNLKTLLEQADHPDPVNRDLAAFALTFSGDDTARAKLLELARDKAGQIRGSAVLGLAIQNKPVETALIHERLQDEDARARGAAAVLAAQTLERGQAGELMPLLIGNLTMDHPWGRATTASAVAQLAPEGSKDAAKALVAAYKAEGEEGLKPAYLAALRQITGIESDAIGAYDEWLGQDAAQPKG